MRSKGSRVTLGVWVLRVYSIDVSQPFATVCNCSQPSATVRNRSRLAVPLASSARVVTFGGFNRCVLVASFSEDELHLQAQNFGDLHRHFAWQAQQAQHLRRVVWHILGIAFSGLRQVLTTCKLWGRRDIL